jgi:excisionase family DNA binding protein
MTFEVIVSEFTNKATLTPFEPVLTSREGADLLRMHHKTLERKARRGEIPGYYYNGCWHFRASELDAWLRSAVKSAVANPSVLNRRIA